MSSTFFSTTSFAGADPAVAAAISVRASRKPSPRRKDLELEHSRNTKEPCWGSSSQLLVTSEAHLKKYRPDLTAQPQLLGFRGPRLGTDFPLRI
jgi:hypothetical protein